MIANRPPFTHSKVRRFLAALALLGMPVVFATCRVGELIGPATESLMVVTVDSIAEIAALGSTAATRLEFDVNNARDGSLPWTAEVVRKSSWLTLSLNKGTAPSQITAILSPVGLSEGVYRDTLRIIPGSGPSNPFSIPVVFFYGIFQLLGC